MVPWQIGSGKLPLALEPIELDKLTAMQIIGAFGRLTTKSYVLIVPPILAVLGLAFALGASWPTRTEVSRAPGSSVEVIAPSSSRQVPPPSSLPNVSQPPATPAQLPEVLRAPSRTLVDGRSALRASRNLQPIPRDVSGRRMSFMPPSTFGFVQVSSWNDDLLGWPHALHVYVEELPESFEVHRTEQSIYLIAFVEAADLEQLALGGRNLDVRITPKSNENTFMAILDLRRIRRMDRRQPMLREPPVLSVFIQ